MSRALRFTLIIGFAVALVLVLLHESGLLLPLDRELAGMFGLTEDTPLRAPVLQYLTIGGLAFGIAWTTIDINRFDLKAIVAGATLAQVLSGAAVVALFGAYFSPLLPSLAVLLSFFSAFFYARTDTGQRQRQVESLYGRRISNATATALVESRVPLEQMGHLQELTIVVCEIFNHPALMSELKPAEYISLNNEFLSLASETLVEAGGCLAECDGEGVRVIFGTPLPQPDHAARACAAGLALAKKLDAFNQRVAEGDGQVCDWRIGVNSGVMITGSFGGDRLAGFGVAGDEVEFARRLCAANLIYGSSILAGARTYEMAEGAVEVRPMELLRRRQDENWLEVYELLGLPEEVGVEERERRDLYWTAVIYYREKRLAEALERFQHVRALSPGADGPVDFYIQRIRTLQLNNSGADFETARLLNSL